MGWPVINGSRHGNSLLNEETVRKIRKNIATGAKIAHLAEQHMVARKTIYDIRDRKTWKHV